jgi:hypothetical protein
MNIGDLDLHKATVHFILETYIKNVFPKHQEFILDIRENLLPCPPSEIDSALQELGWERLDFDSNGWQQDTWYWYSNPNYDFQLTMEYSGFYGDLKLYRRDCDDVEVE